MTAEPTAERRVFADYGLIENRGHVLEAWSDDDRYSYGVCSCDHWMSGAATDAEDVLASWRTHIDSLTEVENPAAIGSNDASGS